MTVAGIGLQLFQTGKAFAAKPEGSFKLRKDEEKWKIDYGAVAISVFAIGFGIFFTKLLAPTLRETQNGLAKLAFGLTPKEFIKQIERNLPEGKTLNAFNRAMCHGGEFALPIVLIEAGARLLFGYERALSPIGGVAGLLFWNRIGVQYWKLDPTGSSTMFLMASLDAFTQIQSGESWRDLNYANIALRFGTVTLFGTARARWVRNFIYRQRGQRGMKSVYLQTGNLKSKTLVFQGRGKASRVIGKEAQALEADEAELVRKLFATGNHNNVVWVSRDGLLVNRERLLRGMGTKPETLSGSERERLAKMLRVEEFEKLFDPATQGRLTESVTTGQYYVQIKLGGANNMLGFWSYFLIQEPLTSPLIDATLGFLFRGEDFGQIFFWTLVKGAFMLPRQAWKLRMGVDTVAAITGDRGLKLATEPVLTKVFPIYASKGLWRKHYGENVIECHTLDDFLNLHIGPNIWDGGLARYNSEIFLDPRNLANAWLPDWLGKLESGEESPYTPMVVSYKLLAEFYATTPDKLKPREREVIEDHIDRLITEAENRLQKREKFPSKYNDATIIEHALVISAAAYYAHQHNEAYFKGLMGKHKEWFGRFKAIGKSIWNVQQFVAHVEEHAEELGESLRRSFPEPPKIAQTSTAVVPPTPPETSPPAGEPPAPVVLPPENGQRSARDKKPPLEECVPLEGMEETECVRNKLGWAFIDNLDCEWIEDQGRHSLDCRGREKGHSERSFTFTVHPSHTPPYLSLPGVDNEKKARLAERGAFWVYFRDEKRIPRDLRPVRRKILDTVRPYTVSFNERLDLETVDLIADWHRLGPSQNGNCWAFALPEATPPPSSWAYWYVGKIRFMTELAKNHPETLQEFLTALNSQLGDPHAKWRSDFFGNGREEETKRIFYLALLIRHLAERATRGEETLRPFQEMVARSPYTEFWKEVPYCWTEEQLVKAIGMAGGSGEYLETGDQYEYRVGEKRTPIRLHWLMAKLRRVPPHLARGGRFDLEKCVGKEKETKEKLGCVQEIVTAKYGPQLSCEVSDDYLRCDPADRSMGFYFSVGPAKSKPPGVHEGLGSAENATELFRRGAFWVHWQDRWLDNEPVKEAFYSDLRHFLDPYEATYIPHTW